MNPTSFFLNDRFTRRVTPLRGGLYGFCGAWLDKATANGTNQYFPEIAKSPPCKIPP
jgi:hypothetical protein